MLSHIIHRRPVDIDAFKWRGALAGAVRLNDLQRTTLFIRSDKQCGAWALTDDYWVHWLETAAQSLVSLKQLRTATVVSAPVFAPYRGYTFDGAANYVNTGFVPSTAGINLTGTNQRLSVYARANLNSNVTAIGNFTSATVNMRIVTRNSASMVGTMNSGTASFTITSVNLGLGNGYSVVSRAGGGTTANGWKNGVRLTDVTGLTVGTTLPALNIYIGARNNAGTADNFAALPVGFSTIGAPLGSDAAELAHYNNVQAWATTIGASA